MNSHFGELSYQIVEKLWRKNRIFCSTDYDSSLDQLNEYLPLKVDEYHHPHQGWEIPPKWDLLKATISYKGDIIFEATHPLQVIGLSLPFVGRISLEELKKHLHTDKRDPTSTPYHFRQHYRPWNRDWGFCVPQIFINQLEKGEYDVAIITDESPGVLKVATCHLPGSTPYGFAFVAHLDHPGMANDDLAGVAVGVELFHELSKMSHKYSYTLILVQEMIGSEYYLHSKSQNFYIESCFLEMLGTQTPLALQRSYQNRGKIGNILSDHLSEKRIPHKIGSFREVICNDESVWESYGIPMCSISRYPYPEYHSDKDNLNIISKDSLGESVSIIFDCIQHLERLTLIKKLFLGVPGLAHPSIDLYIDPGQPAFNQIEGSSLRRVMDMVPLLPNISFLEDLAEMSGASVSEVREYLYKWQKKGLIELN